MKGFAIGKRNILGDESAANYHLKTCCIEMVLQIASQLNDSITINI